MIDDDMEGNNKADALRWKLLGTVRTELKAFSAISSQTRTIRSVLVIYDTSRRGMHLRAIQKNQMWPEGDSARGSPRPIRR
jgi:hypothetical protein